MNDQPAYNFNDARYAKNCVAVTIPSADGWKTPAHVIADGVKARFSHREKAYIMTQSQFRRFQSAFQEICKHSPDRLFSHVYPDGSLFVGCCDCGKPLCGGATL